MATIDVRNLACPAPLIKTKQALDKAEPGSTLQIVGNGAIPSNNLKNYLNELGINYKEVQVEEEWILSFVVPEMGKTEVDAGSFCPTSNAAPAQGQTALTKGAPVPPQNAPGQNPEDFQKKAHEVSKEGVVDVYPSDGKRTGHGMLLSGENHQRRRI